MGYQFIVKKFDLAQLANGCGFQRGQTRAIFRCILKAMTWRTKANFDALNLEFSRKMSAW